MGILTIALLLFVSMTLGFGALGWFFYKLKESHSSLSADFKRQTRDLKGLYSAANHLTERLIQAERTIADLEKKTDDFDDQQRNDHPYSTAIKLVKNGARVEDLVEQCNVTQDEAELLVRLHGVG